MFNDIGKKIKKLAELVCGSGIILSIIAGLATIILNEDLTLLGILVIIAGSLLSWIGSFFTYGFGELIDKAQEIANCLKGNPPLEPKGDLPLEPKGNLPYTPIERDKKWICPECCRENSLKITVCKCGYERK